MDSLAQPAEETALDGAPQGAAFERVREILLARLQPLLGVPIAVDRHNGQRGIGDILEGRLAEAVIGAAASIPGAIATRPCGRRALEDVRLESGTIDLRLDIKSVALGAAFSMPNLVSIRRLRALYASPRNHLAYLVAGYTQESRHSIRLERIELLLVEEIPWPRLQVGALGLGQLQLKAAQEPIVPAREGREAWMRQLAETAVAHWQREIVKAARENAFWSGETAFARA